MLRTVGTLALTFLLLASCDLTSNSSQAQPAETNDTLDNNNPINPDPVDTVDDIDTEPPAQVEGISNLDMSSLVLRYKLINWRAVSSGGVSTAETLAVRTVIVSKSADTTISGRSLERFLVKVLEADTAQPEVGYAFTEATSSGWYLWGYVGETGEAFRKVSAYWIDNVQIELLAQPQQLLKFPLEQGVSWQGLSAQKSVISFDTLTLATREFVCAHVRSEGDGSQSPASDQWVVNRAVIRQYLVYPSSSGDNGEETIHSDLVLTAIE